ncbi:MAG: YgiT-type zinc finger protein [Nitrospirota bacterium]
MKCVFCGGKIEKANVTFSYEDEDKHKYIFVEDVPAEVCTSCGEKTYSPAVTDDLLKFVKNQFHPVKTIEVPVFNFVEKV